MIRILLHGCNGKMGQTISKIASSSPDYLIIAGIDRSHQKNFQYPVFTDINAVTMEYDVLLDFSRADALNSIINYSMEKLKPVILCTTGYSEEQLFTIANTSERIPVFHSANMSFGINIIVEILKSIAPLLYKDFDIEIIEKHHNQKLDSPSGTALLLANTLKNAIADDTEMVKGRNGYSIRKHSDIGIHSIRGGNIVGDHETIFAGSGEVIEITHKALSRDVFAYGALKACSFMKDKEPGLYHMSHIINDEL